MANWCDFDITFFPSRGAADAFMEGARGVMAIYAALSDARRGGMSLEDIYKAYPSHDVGAPSSDNINVRASMTNIYLENAFRSLLGEMEIEDSRIVVGAMARRATDGDALEPNRAIFGYVGVTVSFDSAWVPCLTAVLQIAKGILRASHIDPAKISYCWCAVERGNGIYVNTDKNFVFYRAMVRLRYYAEGDGADDGLDYEEFFSYAELAGMVEKVRKVCDPELFDKAMETEYRGGALFGEDYVNGFWRLTSSADGMKLVKAAFEKLHPDGELYVDWFETDGSGYEE